MNRDQAFKEIQKNIGVGNKDAVGQQIMLIASNSHDDPMTLLTCASLLKVVEEDEKVDEVVNIIMNNLPSNETSKIEIVKGLKGIGRFKEAAKILENLAICDDIQRERMSVRYGLGDYSGSVESYNLIQEPTLDDEIVMIDALCSMKEFKIANDESIRLLNEAPSDYYVQRCHCSVLLRWGHEKEAESFVKEILKNDKSSANTNALAAYFMWMNGKISAAGAYATKAVKTDPKNIGAMETLAFCLIEKGKINEAKIIAGAINEQTPGHQAVVRILDMCRQ
ncbi:MAG: tetratricopeptide repeat protein [Candidatus Methanogranum gryphiswaldense]|nr:MAG: tetratricopeptide repeat protein [Candidatus Methanogranum sp. U3.2.1]